MLGLLWLSLLDGHRSSVRGPGTAVEEMVVTELPKGPGLGAGTAENWACPSEKEVVGTSVLELLTASLQLR